MWVKNEGVLGPKPSAGDVREVVCLNRIFRWCGATAHRKEAIEIEADARRADIIAPHLSLKADTNGVVTPGVRPTSAEMGDPLPAYEASQFRSIAMRPRTWSRTGPTSVARPRRPRAP